MGIITHVIGFKQPDERFLKMKAVLDACKAARVLVPAEVSSYFDWNSTDGYGEQVEIEKTVAVKQYNDGCSSSGFDVEIAKLPPGVTHIRFYNSW